MRAAMKGTAGLAMAILLAAGCGPPPALRQEVAAELRDRMTSIRTAAEAGDRARAEASLAELRRRVVELEQSGLVDDVRAAEILGAAVGVEAQLTLLPAPAPPTTATTVVEHERDRRGKKKDHEDEDD
jgi:hypothetical protein